MGSLTSDLDRFLKTDGLRILIESGAVRTGPWEPLTADDIEDFAFMNLDALDRDTLARFDRLQKAALGNFIMALDSLTGLCHTQADGQFCGWDRMEFPDLWRELTPQEAEAFIRESFQADRLAISVIRPPDTGKDTAKG